MTRKITIENQEQETENEYIPEVLEENSDFDARIASMLNQIDEEDPVRVTLYKKGKFGKYAICDNLDPDRIDYHEIGTKHGEGEYRIYIKFRKKNEKEWFTRNHTFTIDSYYNKVKERQERQEKQEALTASQPQNNNNDIILQMIAMQNKSAEEMRAFMQMSNQNTMQMLTSFMALAMQNKSDSGAEKVLMTYILDDKREERKQNHEVFLKGLEMGMEQKRLETESADTSWKDVVCTLIENADKILNPFLKGMIKTAMQSPENAKLLENADAMEFFMSGVKERHPDNAEAILKELENIK